jgi:hypothetical protein
MSENILSSKFGLSCPTTDPNALALTYMRIPKHWDMCKFVILLLSALPC